MWVDAGDGRGIVKADSSDDISIRPRRNDIIAADEAGASESEEQRAKHYQGITRDPNLNAFQKLWKDRFTTKGLMERLLRKTVRMSLPSISLPTWTDARFSCQLHLNSPSYVSLLLVFHALGKNTWLYVSVRYSPVSRNGH